MMDECVNRKYEDYSEEDNIFYTQIKQVSISSIIINGRRSNNPNQWASIGVLLATFEIIPNALIVGINLDSIDLML